MRKANPPTWGGHILPRILLRLGPLTSPFTSTNGSPVSNVASEPRPELSLPSWARRSAGSVLFHVVVWSAVLQDRDLLELVIHGYCVGPQPQQIRSRIVPALTRHRRGRRRPPSQPVLGPRRPVSLIGLSRKNFQLAGDTLSRTRRISPVSYTHLTLPTILRV